MIKCNINQIKKSNKEILKTLPEIKRILALNYVKNVVNSKLDATIFDEFIIYIPR